MSMLVFFFFGLAVSMLAAHWWARFAVLHAVPFIYSLAYFFIASPGGGVLSLDWAAAAFFGVIFYGASWIETVRARRQDAQ